MRPFHALLVKWILWRQIRTSGAKSTLQCNSTSCRINSKSKRIPTRQEFIEKEETKQNKKKTKKWGRMGNGINLVPICLVSYLPVDSARGRLTTDYIKRTRARSFSGHYFGPFPLH